MTFSSGFSVISRSEPTQLQVILRRGGIAESIHRVYVVVSDGQGRVLMSAGDTGFKTFIRSALKPFQALPFLSSGAANQMDVGDRGIAISCASHAGTNYHAREVFKLLWKAELDPSQLQCPVPVYGNSPLQHNCSGKHAAFLATSHKMSWPTYNYLQSNHPVQVEVVRQVAELLGLSADRFVVVRDNCGAPTLRLRLVQMALLYANLGASQHAELGQISRAMLAYPELVAGAGRFDTELMRLSHGQVLSKGGSEGIQCLSRIGEGLGVAIKAEDGSRRAKQAAALYVLRKMAWLTPSSLQKLEEQVLVLTTGVSLTVSGALQSHKNA
ncbi:asparaginase [Synechococcus sp. M16CYN]|uniref:asparaginase n=1 Tax=Synechococcus sp. M16CYN TaxID=3103139 RepID=UPI00324382B3